MTGFAILTTTVSDEAEAGALAHHLVEARLCACVQISPVRSVYRWAGKVEEASEHVLVCKIVAADFAAVEAAIHQRHSYDVPEIVLVPIAEGHGPYLDWIAETTRPS